MEVGFFEGLLGNHRSDEPFCPSTLEGINSLSISSSCVAPKRHVEKTTIFGKYPSFVGAEFLVL